MLFSRLRALLQCGHDLFLAETSEQAIDRLTSCRDKIDMVLCDIVLPGINRLKVPALNSVPKRSQLTQPHFMRSVTRVDSE
jgi:CheY-like chemotaxis protein